MAERVWVWHEADAKTVQHLALPPDDVTMTWDGETVCALTGPVSRVAGDNVDGGKACQACTAEPFTLAGDDRGPP
ncbi:MAG: hypothetical protein H0V19_05670 [Euzebyales bacterium]|nr:hypothetical protein [Euzebyales bacterium]MDQ3430624.1 hypothetical protein [Actinomycetota bacterium]